MSKVQKSEQNWWSRYETIVINVCWKEIIDSVIIIKPIINVAVVVIELNDELVGGVGTWSIHYVISFHHSKLNYK